MPSTIYQPKMKTVKVAPAPGAESASSPPTPDAGGDEFVRSSLARTGLRPILLLQAALGVGRAHFTAPGAKLLQGTYVLAIAAALLYQNVMDQQYIFLDVPEGTLSHLRVLSWCDLVECLVYLIFGTFFYRAKVFTMVRKLDGVDATIGLKGDAALALASTLRNTLVSCSILFFNAMLVFFLFLASQRVNVLSITIMCRVVHDTEISYFTAAVEGINYRLRVFDRHVQELAGASDRTDAAAPATADGKEWSEMSVWRRFWWSVYGQPGPESRACAPLDAQRLWRVYTDIVDSADMFNDTISAQILLSAVSSFCHILVTVHMNLMRKQEIASRISDESVWLAVYLGAVVVRNLVNNVRACASAENSKSLSRLINQHVHRRLCDPALDEESRRSVETLALLTSRRPVRYTVYRVFSLDLALPLNFFYLCITYIIVLVQFAKL